LAVASRIIKNTAFLYLKMFITVFSSLYTTRIVLSELGENNFGIFTLVAGMISMLLFLNVALTQATQRYISYYKGKNDIGFENKIFNISLLLHLLIGLLLILILETLAFFLFESVLNIDQNRIEIAKFIFHFTVVSTFFTIIAVPFDAIINAHENMLFVAILGVVESFLKLFVALYLTVCAMDKLFIYGFLMMLIVIVLFFVKIIYTKKKYTEVSLNIKNSLDIKLIKELLSFISYTLFGTTASIVNNYGQVPLVNIFFGTTVNAAQGVATQVSGQLGAFALMFLKAINPVIDKSEGSGNREFMHKTAFAASKFGFLLLCFFYIPVFLEMKVFLDFWLVKVPPYTLLILKLLMVRYLIEQLLIPLASAIFAVGNIKKFQIISSILTILPLPISYYFYSLGYEVYTIYIVNIIYTIINFMLILFFSKILTEFQVFDYLSKVVFRVVLTFIIVFSMATLFHYIFQMYSYRWVVTFFISSVSFILASYFIALNKEEKNYIVSFIKKKLQKEIQ
jgi:O-antigen/teichoic acid export membrane protein